MQILKVGTGQTPCLTAFDQTLWPLHRPNSMAYTSYDKESKRSSTNKLTRIIARSCEYRLNSVATRHDSDTLPFSNNSTRRLFRAATSCSKTSISMIYMSSVMRKQLLEYAKTKAQISFPVTVQLISAFVFAIQIVQSFFFLIPYFQASSHLLWLHKPVCVRPGQVFS